MLKAEPSSICYNYLVVMLTSCLLCALSTDALTQEAPETVGTPEPATVETFAGNPPPVHEANLIRPLSLMSSFEFWLSVLVLLFGSVVSLVEYKLLRQIPRTGEDILRIPVVTLIVVGALFGITAGFNAEQVAPVMGLFGTIAGYLLGQQGKVQEIKKNQLGDLNNE